MCSLALKLNISLIHPALIPTTFSLLKEDQVYAKSNICILKGSSSMIPDNFSFNLVKYTSKLPEKDTHKPFERIEYNNEKRIAHSTY